MLYSVRVVITSYVIMKATLSIKNTVQYSMFYRLQMIGVQVSTEQGMHELMSLGGEKNMDGLYNRRHTVFPTSNSYLKTEVCF